ncbi:MAG: hypothetical protein RLN96_09550 [Pseudomonadales bacterium]
MSNLEILASKAVESGGRLLVRSALNPILWLCGIVSVPALFAAATLNTPPTWLVVLAFTPVIAAVAGFVFLLIFDRDKLQSEEYQIRKRSLELIEQKGDAAPLVIDPNKLDVVEKPTPLPNRKNGGETK